ncbi:SPOR domain-containing protein [Metabacillus litoralis]|uniref:SPOR domain-containing protein n=1 Tax=Metabacillus litoralis TaxID=152268 RepID=A0A5C6VX42_9BACI|nr:SPOR domain-containing protein [Metabacillus litoralis]TXC90097.1 SPOR domain-containing protein [Metabacillus litoralis]
MDKQSSETIKIKINGEDRPLSQGNEPSKEISFSTWEEKVKAEKEMASAKQPINDEEEFPWLLPDEEDSDFKEDPKVVTSPKKKKVYSNSTVAPYLYSKKSNRKVPHIAFPFKQIVTIVLLAIGVGTGFGYIALNFLSNKDMPVMANPSGGTDVVVPRETGEDPAGGEEATDTSTSASSNATLQVYAVQGGSFTAKEGAETLAAQIKDKNLASTVLELDGKFTVIAGLGKAKTETDALNEIYKQKQFVKFWGGKQLGLEVSTSSSADQWVNIITELSPLASAAATGSGVSSENITKLETQINAISPNDAEKPLVDKLLQAVSSLKEQNGWQAQQNLLEVVQAIQKK